MSADLDQTEGPEADVLAFDDLGEILEALSSQESTDPEVLAFESFFADLGARHFKAREFLFMGGAHYGSGACAGLNGYPDRALWDAFRTLVPVLDTVRAALGHSIRLTSIYRSAAYNGCVGGVAQSWHRRCVAADCVVGAVSPADLHAVARRVRDRGDFAGGLGLYDGFVHIDVRGHNADWTG